MQFFVFCTWLARGLFAALLGFELLNRVGILNFPLSFTWNGLIVTLITAWGTVELLNFYFFRKKQNPLGCWALWLTLGMTGIDAAGDILNWYQNFTWYDQTVHLIGGMAAGLIVAAVVLRLETLYRFRLPVVFFLIAGVGIAVSLGVLYELEEYSEDVFTGSKRLGDGFDTANDLLMDGLGSLFAVLVARWRNEKKQRKKMRD